MADFEITERTEPFSLDEVFSFIDDTNISKTDAHELKSRIVDMVQAERSKAIDEVMEIVKKAYHNFSGYDLEFMTKYGNKNASQQAESYSTLMMYEIAGEFDDLIDSLEQLKGVQNE